MEKASNNGVIFIGVEVVGSMASKPMLLGQDWFYSTCVDEFPAFYYSSDGDLCRGNKIEGRTGITYGTGDKINIQLHDSSVTFTKNSDTVGNIPIVEGIARFGVQLHRPGDKILLLSEARPPVQRATRCKAPIAFRMLIGRGVLCGYSSLGKALRKTFSAVWSVRGARWTALHLSSHAAARAQVEFLISLARVFQAAMEKRRRDEERRIEQARLQAVCSRAGATRNSHRGRSVELRGHPRLRELASVLLTRALTPRCVSCGSWRTSVWRWKKRRPPASEQPQRRCANARRRLSGHWQRRQTARGRQKRRRAGGQQSSKSEDGNASCVEQKRKRCMTGPSPMALQRISSDCQPHRTSSQSSLFPVLYCAGRGCAQGGSAGADRKSCSLARRVRGGPGPR